MTKSRGKVLYIGGFELPDKNAAAHRVLAVAKVFRELGYEVEFLNKTTESLGESWIEGFKVHNLKKETSKPGLVRSLYSAKYVIEHLKRDSNFSIVIAYNFPAASLKKVHRFCKKRNIKCIADATEWYKYVSGNVFYTLTKGIDSWRRMRFVHKKLDGMIAISNYLADYYRPYLPVLNLPPMVDKKEAKWIIDASKHDGLRFVYAGSPSRNKERLDLIISAVENLKDTHQVKLVVVGITAEQYASMYKTKISEYSTVDFMGRLSHKEALYQVACADYAFIIRDDNRVTRAGFPTKFTESISAACAVIANENSNIADYIRDGVGGFLVDKDNLKNELYQIAEKTVPTVDSDRFDYHNFIEITNDFLKKI